MIGCSGQPKQSSHRQRHYSNALLVVCLVLLDLLIKTRVLRVGARAIARLARNVPEDERTGVHLRTGTVARAPPTTDDDLSARQHDALVGPKGVHVNAVILIAEELHHSNTLPSRHAVLRRQRVEPALHVEGLRVVGATAAEAVGGGRKIGLVGV
jgi:hypothetical protein